MHIDLLVMGRALPATLADTPTARAFGALLPLVQQVRDFHGIEKVADLPVQLPTEDAPQGAAASAGDLAYYAPWGNLAMFYEDFPHSTGLVLLGRLDDGPALLRELPDGTSIQVVPRG